MLAACSTSRFYVAADLTPENSFGENCEGPNVDKAGNLNVVNFQRDGTVGIATPEGKASIFLELPHGQSLWHGAASLAGLWFYECEKPDRRYGGVEGGVR